MIFWGIGFATQDTLLKAIVAGLLQEGRRNLAFGPFTDSGNVSLCPPCFSVSQRREMPKERNALVKIKRRLAEK
jgi:hypothetical protein